MRPHNVEPGTCQDINISAAVMIYQNLDIHAGIALIACAQHDYEPMRQSRTSVKPQTYGRVLQCLYKGRKTCKI
jgi:hypothetical protein